MSAPQKVEGPSEKVVTAVVADTSQMDCQLLAIALRGCNGLRVIGCATDSTEVTAAVCTDQPDVAIISIRLQDGPLAGLAALRRMRGVQRRTRIIMLLEDEDPALVVEVFRTGVRGVFFRSGAAAELRKCVDRVRKGQIWANNTQIEYLVRALTHAPATRMAKTDESRKLSKRETEIARLVAAGLSNREISNKLGLSAHTVKNYMFRVFEKLGISTRTELVLYVLSQAKPPEREDGAGFEGERPRLA
jgi:DNA-binding NarL/FixJ family response regulator